MMRIDKYLADCGVGTRSEVKKYIKNKSVKVNDHLITKADSKIDETQDQVYFQNQLLVYEKFVYYIFHKPSACVTAKQDAIHKTVMDYFPDDLRSKLSPVGRLDLDTEGLLLLTNDGEFTHHLLSPSHHVPKTYYAKLDKAIPKEAISLFEEGVDIGDEKLTLPARLQILSEKEAHLTIYEGRFHQVKRMFEAVGCQVIYLKRLSMDQLNLGDLELGSYRKLSAEEVEQLRSYT